MKVTVIGFRGGYPLAGEATSCYLIQDNELNIVIDLGAGSLSKLQEHIAIEDIDILILSHYHPDHFSDLYCLQQALLIKNSLGELKKPLKIYAPNDNKYYKELEYDSYIQVNEINEYSKLKFDSVTITFSKTKHIVYALAVKIEKGNRAIVYTSDTEYTEHLADFSRNCSLLLSECSLYDKLNIKGHMDIDDNIKLISKTMPRITILTHLPAYGDNQNIIKEVQNKCNSEVMMANTSLEIII